MKKKTGKCGKTGCKAYPLKGGNYCFAHDPDRQQIRRAEQSRGGKASTAPKTLDSEKFPLQSIPQVKDMLERVTNAVLNGEIDINRARVAGYLASLIMGCLKDYDLEKRMEELEKKLEEIGSRKGR